MTIETVADLTQGWPQIDGIPWSECYPGSPEEELRVDGSRAVRMFFVPWSDRVVWASTWLGYPQIVDEPDPHISRKLPQFHPDYTNISGNPSMWATQILRCEPMGLPDPINGVFQLRITGDIADAAFARITVLYEMPEYDVEGDDEIVQTSGIPDESYWERHVVKVGGPAGDLINLPLASMVYVDDADPANPVPGQTMRREMKSDLSVTWYLVPTAAVGMRTVNENAASFPIDDCVGRVNHDTFNGFRKGTLLLNAVNARRVRSQTGTILWNIEFRFIHIDRGDDENSVPIGHNHLLQYDPADQTVKYREIVANPGAGAADSNAVTQDPGKSLHDWRDFRPMFRVPT